MLRAATIDASGIFHGSFFVGGCADNDDDCLLLEGSGAASIASSSASSDGAVAVDFGGTTAPPPPLVVVAAASSSSAVARSPARVSTAALLAAAIAMAAVARGGVGAWRFTTLRRLASFSWTWYLSRLEAYPLRTKCVTGGLIALFGDYGAQWFEYTSSSSSSSRPSRPSSSSTSTRRRSKKMRMGERGEGDEGEGVSSSSSSSSESAFSLVADGDDHRHGPLSIHGTYVARRGMARFLECLLISSPLMHVGYDFFERVMPIAASSSSGVASTGMHRSLAALSHAVADSVFLDGIFVCTGIVATGLFEGHSLRRRVLPNLRAVYLPTLRASVVTSSALMPLQFLSFRFLPVQLRVLSVNAVDLVWTAVVSFVSHGGGGDGGEELVTAED